MSKEMFLILLLTSPIWIIPAIIVAVVVIRFFAVLFFLLLVVVIFRLCFEPVKIVGPKGGKHDKSKKR